MKIFETHAHLDFKDFDEDRDELIKRCHQNGIEKIINVGVDAETSVNSINLAQKYKDIYAAIGFHPHDAEKFSRDILLSLLNNKKVVAIGEIGLDFTETFRRKKYKKGYLMNKSKLPKKRNCQ